jgi:hypothetical protein
MREQDRLGAAVPAGGEQFERAAAVGVGLGPYHLRHVVRKPADRRRLQRPPPRASEDRTQTHGYAATREDAMIAFAKTWRRK